MRVPIIAANWKMHMCIGEALEFASRLSPRLADLEGTEVVIAPPFTALAPLAEALAGTRVHLAAQNCHPEPSGAFTGEISVAMLADVGCHYAIIGHSERRQLFGETDAQVAQKLAALLDRELGAIVCIGETLDEREAGHTLEVVRAQLDGSLAGLDPERAERVVLAYEPIWAIGTGRTATPEEAQEVHAQIRAHLHTRLGRSGQRMRIQYGGSVKPQNIHALMEQPDIDGALVGGASLDPESFWAIIRFDLSPGESA
ncbi:MAG: triose-phosphate isomerase [Myxococcota bacterium]